MEGLPHCTSRTVLKMFRKLGFRIDTSAGKGSHTKVTDPKTGRSTVVPYALKSQYTAEGIIKWTIQLGYKKDEILRLL